MNVFGIIKFVMKKGLKLICIFLILDVSLFAANISNYSFSNRAASPFRSVSYYGDFYDFFVNPATLPLVEDNQGSFMFNANYSDIFPFDAYSEPISYIQNQLDEMSVSFVGKSIALTANLGTNFTNKVIKDGISYFDIYSNADIEIDWAYAFPYFAFGVSMKGGNSLVRNDKPISSSIDAVANAWFSPFDRSSGSERFSVGSGLLFYFDNFAIGLNIDKIVTLNESNSISADWRTIGQSSNISFSANGNRFTKNGNLTFILPKASLSFSDFLDYRYTISLKGDLSFQFLPECDLSLGLGYREYNHSLFAFDGNNGLFDIYLQGNMWATSITIGVTFDCSTWRTVSPAIGFSFAS